MKVLKIVLLVLTIGLGSTLSEKDSSFATIIKGGSQTIHSILAVNPAVIAVVGDYKYFLNCSKYKLNFKNIYAGPEVKKTNTYSSCYSAPKIKTC